jgi:hypothetical protein
VAPRTRVAAYSPTASEITRYKTMNAASTLGYGDITTEARRTQRKIPEEVLPFSVLSVPPW